MREGKAAHRRDVAGCQGKVRCWYEGGGWVRVMRIEALAAVRAGKVNVKGPWEKALADVRSLSESPRARLRYAQ